MPLRAALLCLSILLAFLGLAESFHPIPEAVYEGDPTITTLRVEGGTPTRLTTPPAVGFVESGTGWAIEAEDCRLVGSMTTVADETASGGEYVTMPLGSDPFSGQIGCRAPVACIDCYVYLILRQPSNTEPDAWVDTSPIIASPDNADATLVHGGQVQTSFAPMIVGRYGALSADTGQGAYLNKINTVTAQPFTFTVESGLYLTLSPDKHLDYIFIDDIPDASPTPPEIIPEDPPDPEDPPPPPPPPPPPETLVSYDVLKIDTAGPASCADSRLPQANTVLWTGINTSTDAPCTVRMLWEDAADDWLYLCATCPDNDLRGTTTADDTSASLNDDQIQFHYRDDQSTTARDAETFNVSCNVRGAKFSANYPGGVSTVAYDPSLTCNAAWTGTLDNTPNDTQVEYFMKFKLGFAGADGYLFNGDFGRTDLDAATTIQNAFNSVPGGFTNPTNWKTLRLSGTVAVAPPDTTPPTHLSTSIANITSTSGSVTSTWSDNQSSVVSAQTCWGQTSGGPYGTCTSHVNTSGSCNPPTSSCSATNNLTGLPSGTTVYLVAKGTDQAGLLKTSPQSSFVTSAAGVTRYINPSGTNNGNCTGSGSPCKTFAHVVPLLQPGETLVLQDGTYTSGNSGYPKISCKSDTPGGYTKGRNGTSSQRITMKAANERMAFLDGNGTARPFQMADCAYWTIEGIRKESGDFQSESGADEGTVFSLRDSNNMIVKRNLWQKNNRYKNAALVFYKGSNSLFEENEGYFFHRQGLQQIGGSFNIYRRNFFHSRSYDDIPNGYDSAGDSGKGDSCFSAYTNTNNDNIWENNIGEDCTSAFRINAQYGAADRNKYFGNVSRVTNSGVWFGSGDSGTKMPHDAVVENQVVISSATGLLMQSVASVDIRNVSVFNSSGAGVLVVRNSDPARRGNGVYAVDVLNTLIKDNGGTGLSIESTIQTRVVNEVNSHGNKTNYSVTSAGNCTGCTNATQIDPLMGAAKICTPDTSQMDDAGLNGGPLGANILNRHQNGILTATKLWTQTKPTGAPNSTSGWYFPCGQVISGWNNTSGSSCYDVTDRIGVTTAVLDSCVPGSY